ncbi:MAG: metallopeptidase family protein [bacterium]|nr:metallopeptidase family protein [bacterium]
MHLSDEEFEQIVNEAIDSLEEQTAHTKNLAIVTADDPSPDQREKLKLMPGHTLFGLYEGIPLIRRGSGYSMVLPDKITIFKNPILAVSPDIVNLKRHVKRTVWHEIAHHYGLDHEDMEKRMKIDENI